MTGLLFGALIVVGIYGAWYPYREVDAREYFEERTNERAAIIFARNCRLCHGDVAQGGALGARLPAAPALDRPDLQGFVDSKETLRADAPRGAATIQVSNGGRFEAGKVILIDEERMKITGINGNQLSVERAVGHTADSGHLNGSPISLLDPAVLKDRVTLITNTIACGRVGTAMPPWAQVNGGPLSQEQVRQLMTLITTARWDLVEEEVQVEDKISATLLTPLTLGATVMQVSDMSVFNKDEAIRIGDERLRVKSVPTTVNENGQQVKIAKAKDKSGTIAVERGVLQTSAEEHALEEGLYRFPEVAEPAVTQTSCGQLARPPIPPGTPETIEDFSGQSLAITAQNVVYDKKELTVSTGGRVRVRLDNKDQGVQHNIAFYKSSTDITPVADGSIGTVFAGPGVDDTVFSIPSAGSYYFRCDIHPTTMTGTFTVR